MKNPVKLKLIENNPDAMRQYGKGQALLRSVKSLADLMGVSFLRLRDASKQIMAQTIPGVQDQIMISVEPEPPPIEEEIPTPVYTMEPCLVQYVHSEMKIFFLCHKEIKNCYIDLNDLGDTFEGLKCLAGLSGFNFSAGGFVYRRNATTQVLCLFKLTAFHGKQYVTYDGHTYRRRVWELRKTTFPIYPANPPLRTYPARSIQAGTTVTGVETAADAYLLMYDGAAIPIHLALWIETKPTNDIPLSTIKFQVICWISVTHTVQLLDGAMPVEGLFRYHFQNIYFDGVNWNQVPDPSEDNWELILSNVYAGYVYNYYEGIFGIPGYPIILRHKDWYWGSDDRHEIFLNTYCCAPIYRDDLRGIAGYLKLHATHVADQASDPVTVHDRTETVFVRLAPASQAMKITYDRSYTRVADDTDYQLLWRRGGSDGIAIYIPEVPSDSIHPVSGGIESRCGAQDRNCGVYYGPP